jgi:anti-sigma-K factor RskA
VGADGRNGAIIVDKLPPLDPETEEYQLWLIRDGEHTSGAILAVDEMGYGGRRVSAPDNLLTYTTVRMTIESLGGSPNPTGEVVLVGTLTSP